MAAEFDAAFERGEGFEALDLASATVHAPNQETRKMRTGSDLPKSIRQQHQELFIEAMSARRHYGIYNVLTNNVDVPCFREVMERYADFFHLTITAQLYCVVIRLGKLFDNKNVSMPSLLKRLKRSLSSNHQTLQIIDRKMNAIAPRVKKILSVRHKALAHLSLQDSSKEIFGMAGMTDHDLNVLTQQSLEILGDIGPLVDGHTNVEFSSTVESTRKMLSDLKRR